MINLFRVWGKMGIWPGQLDHKMKKIFRKYVQVTSWMKETEMPSKHAITYQGGGYYTNFNRSVIFLFFWASPKYTWAIEYHVYILQCRRSAARVTCQILMWCKESNRFFGSKILLTDKLPNGALITPTPEFGVTDSKVKNSSHQKILNAMLTVWKIIIFPTRLKLM